jgi:hypothetical protein
MKIILGGGQKRLIFGENIFFDILSSKAPFWVRFWYHGQMCPLITRSKKNNRLADASRQLFWPGTGQYGLKYHGLAKSVSLLQ